MPRSCNDKDRVGAFLHFLQACAPDLSEEASCDIAIDVGHQSQQPPCS